MPELLIIHVSYHNLLEILNLPQVNEKQNFKLINSETVFSLFDLKISKLIIDSNFSDKF